MLLKEKRCLLCNGKTNFKDVILRSGENSMVYSCIQCNFEFFDYNNKSALQSDKLDYTRLLSSGLNIPSIQLDFENGTRQSRSYIEQFIYEPIIEEKILEIGCSTGYFLKLLCDLDAAPYGLEINESRAQFVRDELGIPCYTSLDKIEEDQLQFKKIFMFYTLEYIPEPVEYIMRLIKILDSSGELIVVTPNLDDVLKNDWDIPAYEEFFYEKCSICYYSISAIKVLGSKVKKTFDVDIKITTEQGYSLFNHVNWLLNERPSTTGIVGGDNLPNKIIKSFSDHRPQFVKNIKHLIRNIDADYKTLIEQNGLGNRILFRIKKF